MRATKSGKKSRLKNFLNNKVLVLPVVFQDFIYGIRFSWKGTYKIKLVFFLIRYFIKQINCFHTAKLLIFFHLYYNYGTNL